MFTQSESAQSKLRIVIDIGGTKTLTKCYLSDKLIYEDLHLTDSTVNEFEQLRTALNKALSHSVKQGWHATETNITVGSAGYTPSTRVQYETLLNSLPDAYPSFNIKNIIFGNDSEIPLLINPSFILSIVAGTGSNIFVRTPNGEIEEFGRFYTFYTSSQGSGFKIATTTINTLANKLEHRNLSIDEQILLKIFKRTFPDRVPKDLVMEQDSPKEMNPSDRQRAAGMAEGIIGEAIKGNASALTIIESEIERFCKTIHDIITTLYPAGREIPTVMTGSVGNNLFISTIYERYFSIFGNKTGHTYLISYNTKDLPFSGFTP